ncbi:FKBP-type peptidyl-prolyl cis-trans isomerase [Leifsonia poae]|uniref:FKBP-type peptidyl-prolyl cis-trans isomerase n=1 Tax=Leifsonia poae TaxID=110933 RepID=UPI001CBCE82C|nr:peptidylprolyl isomerase [Leifsonia poae]
MRRATALVVAAGLLAVTLTGCSSNPNANCDTALKPGSASDLVKVSGKLGEKPKVSFPTPIKTTKSERSTVIQGDGAMVQKNQLVEIEYSVFDGNTGATLQASSYAKDSAQLVPVGTINIPAFNTALQCTSVGSRIAVAIAPKDSGSDASAGTAIAVIDVVKAYLAKADGTPQPSVSGFPTVVLAPTGQPGITIPGGSAPTSVTSETLKAGSGATVKKDSSVVVQYTAVGWENKNVVVSTWQNGSPDLVVVDTGQSATAQGNVLPQDMTRALVGQKVGSQIAVLTPASKDGSFPASAWVVDILGIR